jgi:muconolactone D-isomerase
MLFHVHIQVPLPTTLEPEFVSDLRRREGDRARELQRQGVLKHLWRIAGQQANYSVWDAPTNDDLHAYISSLPMYAYTSIVVTPLATHPNAL